jgi:hypothetical protein
MKERRRGKEEEKKQKREEAEKRRAQLDLVVDEPKSKEFKVNLEDERFKAVYSDPSYAPDPQDPRFDHRRSGRVFSEVVRRNRGRH